MYLLFKHALLNCLGLQIKLSTKQIILSLFEPNLVQTQTSLIPYVVVLV